MKSVRKPNSPFFSKKKESLNIVLSGDIPLGPSSILKQEIVDRLNSAINPSFRGLERDFSCEDITNILVKNNNSIVLRLCSQEVKNLVVENRKLLSCSFPSRPSSAEPAFPIQPPRA